MLSAKMTAAFAERLRGQQVSLEEELRLAEEAARPVSLDLPIGRITRMDAMQDQQMALARTKRIQLRMRAVAAALGRIQAGTFGVCPSCDDDIGLVRLEARPDLPLCRDCQEDQGRG
jgi:RNA polymerase-binding transcription factor